MESYETPWVPKVGLAIRRKHDPDAPKHWITAVKGVGASRMVAIDQAQTRFWPVDMFEPCDAVPDAVGSLLDQEQLVVDPLFSASRSDPTQK